VHALADGIQLCRLFRADGSRFAHARVDRLRQVLEVRFFRTSGTLRFAVDASDPAIAASQGAEVSCGSAASDSINKRYWRETFRWRVGKVPSNLPSGQVIHALRAAQSEWTNNINWCGYPDHAEALSLYEGRASRRPGHDGANTVDWGPLNSTQNCSRAVACAATWYDGKGNPVEADIRFNGSVRWSVRAGSGDNDIQSVAAHEFGHARQFGHVTSHQRKHYTVVMWPYFERGDTSGRKLGRGDALANNKHY
jgi:Matrixin